MKSMLLGMAMIGALVAPSAAVDPHVTYTIQALSGLVGDTPRFVKVYCHDTGLGPDSRFSLICAPNIPPTNSKEKLTDHNVLSGCGIVIQADLADEPVAENGKFKIAVTLNLTSIKTPASIYDGTEESLIRMAFECIRLVAELDGTEYSVEIKAKDRILPIAEKVRQSFLEHDKRKPFYHHPGKE